MKQKSIFCVLIVIISLSVFSQTKDELNKKLLDAVYAGNLEQVKSLIMKGANINGREQIYGLTAIHIAVLTNNKEMLKLLIQNGSDINIKNNHNLTPYHIALIQGNKDIIEFLIKNGAKKDIDSMIDEIRGRSGE